MRVLKLIIILLVISCYNKEELFSMESIQEFSSPLKEENIDNEIVDISVVDVKEYVFIKVYADKKIAKIPVEELYIIYQKYYKDEDYILFLYKVLNFKKAIPIQYFNNQKGLYTLNNEVLQIYKEKGIEEIKNIYTIEKEIGKFFINPVVNEDDIITIQYLFYINKYEYYHDDYIPLMWFEKSGNFSLYKK